MKVKDIAKKLPKGKTVALEEAIKLQGGKKIAPAVRSKIEAAFGEDFSDVRVHKSEELDGVLDSLGARAFTQGSDIVMRLGGTKIEHLAHECCHVVQQSSGTTLNGKKVMVCS